MSPRNSGRLARVLVAVVALSAGLAGALRAQDRGMVVGTLTDKATGQPLAGAQVVIVGTGQGTLTDRSGVYRLGGVPAGQASVRVVMIGYESITKTATVPSGGAVTVDFALTQTAISLNEVMVTVTGEQQKKEIANSVTQIDASSVTKAAPVTSFDQLLNGRAAGVDVLSASGSVGTGSRIRIRGANSVSLNNQPIIYLDGTRIDSDPSNLSVGTGGQTISRLSDLNPEDIESIEIIKGPSAATLYGTDAANGVIRITTKRGRSGAPVWNAFVETGQLSDPNAYPLNYRGKTANDVSSSSCYLYQVGAGSCTQAKLFSYQPLTDPVVSPLANGSDRQIGINVRGGGDAVNYFISGDYLKQVGTMSLPDSARQGFGDSPIPDWTLHPNSTRKVNLRANIGAMVADGLNLRVSSGFVTSRTHLPQNDNNALGIVPSGMLGSYSPELGQHGYGFLTPTEVFSIEAMQEINRYTASTQANWQPRNLGWLSARATVGMDVTDRHDSSFSPVGAVTEFGPVRASGLRTSNRFLIQQWTADLNATANAQLTDDISSRTTVGSQYFKNISRATRANGDGLTPGTKSLGASSEQFASESTAESITFGVYAEQQFGYKDRLFVTAGLRGDDNSAFGKSFKASYYPRLGASYVLVDDNSSPVLGVVNSLRLRAVEGVSGVAPGPLDALRYYNASVAKVQGGSEQPGVTFGELGNIDLKPERSTELELGFDASVFDSKLGVQFTYYHKKTTDALISRTLAPSLGASSSRFENIGSVLNKGVELTLNATLLDRESVKLALDVSGSHNRNELLKLGEGIEPIIQDKQQFREGYSLGGYWDNPITYKDANGDGIISSDEITRGDTAVFIGNVLPANQVSITPTLTLYNRVRISTLFDYRGGFRQYNNTEEFRCRFAICRGLNDPSAPLWDQARAVNTVTLGGSRSAQPYIENASFWKLRELSLTLFAPDEWAHRVGAQRMNLVITGRNLVKWTNYTGLDPEINQTATSNFVQREFLTQPPIRMWLARVNITF